jgi:transcriptional regulator with XRE-family HTH domain
MANFNYKPLLGLIREKSYTQESLAAATGISISQLSAKLNGRYPFKQTDIQSIVDVLDISPTDIGRYFFAVEVEKTQRKEE